MYAEIELTNPEKPKLFHTKRSRKIRHGKKTKSL